MQNTLPRSASLTLVLARRLKRLFSTFLVLVAMMILLQQHGDMAIVIGWTVHTYGESPGCIACTYQGWHMCVCVCVCASVRFHTQNGYMECFRCTYMDTDSHTYRSFIMAITNSQGMKNSHVLCSCMSTHRDLCSFRG